MHPLYKCQNLKMPIPVVSALTKMNIIVAACESDLGIGKNGQLPWRLKKEMQYFSSITRHVKDPSKQNAVIMGRKTWESIPEKFRPLKSRTNIVLSTTMVPNPDQGQLISSSLQKALDAIKQAPLSNLIENVWVIGGSSVYEEAMKHSDCHRIYITWIKKTFDCDTFLPKIPLDFEEVKDDLVPQGLQEENGLQYEIRVYEREEKGKPTKTEVIETCV